MGVEFKVNGKDLIAKIEELIREGNIRRIIIKDEKGNTFIEIPVNIGILGVICAPILAAVGAIAAVVSNFTVEVVKREDTEEVKSNVTNP
jgi:DNA gyrase/topoisomerase IV subunit A